MSRRDDRHIQISGGSVIDADRFLAPAPPDAAFHDVVSDMMDGLPALAADLSPIQQLLRTSVAKALARRKVPANNLSWPRLEIAVPAMEALRYSELHDQFANLIASSMDARASRFVLPAYVEVLKQLSADELEILKNIPPAGRFAPIADLVFVFPNDQIVVGFRHILSPAMCIGVRVPQNIPQYIDNLCRLSLLSRPAGQEADSGSYRPLTQQGFVKTLIAERAPPKSQAGFDKAVIGLTDFGERFRSACLG